MFGCVLSTIDIKVSVVVVVVVVVDKRTNNHCRTSASSKVGRGNKGGVEILTFDTAEGGF